MAHEVLSNYRQLTCNNSVSKLFTASLSSSLSFRTFLSSSGLEDFIGDSFLFPLSPSNASSLS